MLSCDRSLIIFPPVKSGSPSAIVTSSSSISSTGGLSVLKGGIRAPKPSLPAAPPIRPPGLIPGMGGPMRGELVLCISTLMSVCTFRTAMVLVKHGG